MRTPILRRTFSPGSLRLGRHEAIIPHSSSSFVHIEGPTVACIGSPCPNVGQVESLTQYACGEQARSHEDPDEYSLS